MLVNANVLTCLAIDIVLYRSTTVELAVVHIIVEVHHHSETHKVAHLCTCSSLHLLLNGHCALAIYIVCDGKCSLNIRHVVHGYNTSTYFTHLSACYRCKVDCRIAPSLELVLQVGTHIIVGYSTPEVRTQCTTLGQQVLASYVVSLQQACGLIEYYVQHILYVYADYTILLIVGNLKLSLLSGLLHRCRFGFAHNKLTISYYLTLVHKRLSILQAELDV